MHNDVHLNPGKRIINTKTNEVGKVAEPFYMCRPEHHEICVQYDSGDVLVNEDRADIEYEGSESYKLAMQRRERKSATPAP